MRAAFFAFSAMVLSALAAFDVCFIDPDILPFHPAVATLLAVGCFIAMVLEEE